MAALIHVPLVISTFKALFALVIAPLAAARFDQLGPEESLALATPETLPIALTTEEGIGKLFDATKGVVQKVRDIVAEREGAKATASAKGKDLKPQALAAQLKAIDDAYQNQIDEQTKKAGSASELAERAEAPWQREAKLRSAKFAEHPGDNAAMSLTALTRAQLASEPELHGMAAQAQIEQSPAMAHAISAELSSPRRKGMSPGAKAAVQSMLDRIPDGGESVRPMIAKIKNAGREALAVDGSARQKIAAGVADAALPPIYRGD